MVGGMAATKTESVKTEDEAQLFVDHLLIEGCKVSCDGSNENFHSHYKVPEFYDERLFKRGQEFFGKHMYAMFFSKLHGLITILAVPTILKILIMTKMSGNNMTAYRRYVATIFHMMVWYDKDFKPGSDLWKSVGQVRTMHDSASKRSKSCGMHRISQMDMALTQFGFMGFALSRSTKVGIHNATEEEWAGFIHIWRVVGHLMGIEDRFNICRGTVAETRQICNLLLSQVFKPHCENRYNDFLDMARHLIEGLWSAQPMLQYESMMSLNHALVSMNTEDEMKPVYFDLKLYPKFNFWLITIVIGLMKYHWMRIIHNLILIVTLWLLKVFPFLAYHRFGISNSYVKLRLT